VFHSILGGMPPTRMPRNRSATAGYVLKRRGRRIHMHNIFHRNLSFNRCSFGIGYLICIRMRLARALLILLRAIVEPRTAKGLSCHRDHQASEWSDRGISQQVGERRDGENSALLQDQDCEMSDQSSLISNFVPEH